MDPSASLTQRFLDACAQAQVTAATALVGQLPAMDRHSLAGRLPRLSLWERGHGLALRLLWPQVDDTCRETALFELLNHPANQMFLPQLPLDDRRAILTTWVTCWAGGTLNVAAPEARVRDQMVLATLNDAPDVLGVLLTSTPESEQRYPQATQRWRAHQRQQALAQTPAAPSRQRPRS